MRSITRSWRKRSPGSAASGDNNTLHLEQLPGGPHLTYCTNIHAGETWGEISASLDAHVPAIKATVSPDAPMGLGLRLSGIAAAELMQPRELQRFRDQLACLDAYVFTIN